jgi:hypothetical protein
MSTLAVNTITNAAGGNTAQINGMTPTAQSLQGFRNRLINGNMLIAQRGTATVTMSTTVQYVVDRWLSYEDTDGTMTAQQSTTVPAGFTNSLLCTTTVADASLGATQRVLIAQRVEGFNVADLGWGSASAQAVTVSFWVRSSLTGTFGGAIKNSASTRGYPFTYSISAANTWEQKTVTIPGDTSGTWLTDNGTGLEINFGLGVGSTYSGTAGAWAAADFNSATGAVSVIGTSGATFYITGVQLEAGSVATPFERRPYGTELALCQRYYWKLTGGGSFFAVGSPFAGIGANQAVGSITLPVTMRTTPTGINVSGTYTVNSAGFNPTLTIDAATCTPLSVGLVATSNGNFAQYRACQIISLGNASNFIDVTGVEL